MLTELGHHYGKFPDEVAEQDVRLLQLHAIVAEARCDKCGRIHARGCN